MVPLVDLLNLRGQLPLRPLTPIQPGAYLEHAGSTGMSAPDHAAGPFTVRGLREEEQGGAVLSAYGTVAGEGVRLTFRKQPRSLSVNYWDM